MSRHTAGILFACLTGFCWAILAIILKYALQFSSTGTIVWVRMTIATTVLFAFYAVKSPSILRKIYLSPSPRILVAGLLLAFNYFGYLKGLGLTSASNAQIMIQMGPLTLLLVGVLYFKEPLRLIQWLGVVIAVVGFLFFNWDQLLATLDQSPVYISGNIWLFFAAITWAGFAILQKIQLRQNWSPQMINLLIYTVCAVVLFPFANLNELTNLTAWQWFVLFALGLNTLVAYGSLAEAISRIPASVTSLIISINPLLTIFFVTLIAEFHLTFIRPEPIMWRGYLGAALVVSGVAVAVSLRKRAKTSALAKNI